MSFQHDQDLLEGTLVLPIDKKSIFSVVLLVHGDGPQDRWSEGGYFPLVNFLISQGIAVFSWDKPGVGKSTGNWLSQTMEDRANEAVFLLKKVKEQPELKKSRIGYLGFSQAGWVVPRACQLVAPDFIVLIGVAINWREQGFYYTRKRLESEGYSFESIKQAEKRESENFDNYFTEETALLPCSSRCTRQDFERRNSNADAKKDISKMFTSVLLLMGEDDRNVDPYETVDIWTKELPSETNRCIKLVPKATHGLLRSEWYDYQLSSQWPLWKQGLFLLSGQYSYPPNVLNTISSWILNQRCTY